LPGTATKVAVTAGATSDNIDGHLHGAASISGTVTAVGGGELSALVQLYLDGVNVRAIFANGSYFFGGLAPSATGYAVCVLGSSVSDVNAPTGYLGRCYKTSAFNGITPPAGADLVPVTDQEQQTGIDIALPKGAAISGKIVNGAGTGIKGVSVRAKNRSTNQQYSTVTGNGGTYELRSLPASANGYSVCADPSGTNAGSTGYRPRCYNDVAWSGGSFPAGATKVNVSLGQVKPGVNIKLAPGAAISGKVTEAGSGHPLSGSGILVFSAAGKILGSTSANARGKFALKGLPAGSGNKVCALPRGGSTPNVSYKGECWKNVSWTGGASPSAGADGVSTSIGHLHANVNLTLTKVTTALGTISGTITEHTQASANPLEKAVVHLFTASGTEVAQTLSATDGTYHFDTVRPNATGYRVCAEAVNFTFAPAIDFVPTGGWAPRCYDDVAWTGLAVPSAAAKIPINPGQHKSAVDIELAAGGEITGTVFEFGSDTPVTNVQVTVFTPAGGFVGQALSGVGNGIYFIYNLPPSPTGYVVCFDGREASFQNQNYLPQCWTDQPWDGAI
jgi:hypothetical protein